jgi:hypothetical protein
MTMASHNPNARLAGARARRLFSAQYLGSLTLFLSLCANGAAVGAPCEVADVGGTAGLPPIGCEYIATGVPIVIVNGLPPGTTIELEPVYKDFICDGGPLFCSLPISPGICEVPGGSQGGSLSCSSDSLELQVTGTGALAGFSRFISVPTGTEIHTAPRTPGDPVQAFDTELVTLQADLFGDPDFDTLRIRAGSTFGLPSPGHTTLTQKNNGNWQVDSFFDVEYTIDFVGAPGSVLDGLAGSTTSDFQMATNTNPCDVPDNGSFTVDLPPAGCDYITPDEEFVIDTGLPPGTTIVLDAIHNDFVCGTQQSLCTAPLPPGLCETVGGSLGGSAECFGSALQLAISGTGALAGFNRTIVMPMDVEVHTGPRVPGDPVQSFPSQLFRLQGQIFGDPDFCVFSIQSGDQLGLPSPGAKLLSDNGDGTFAVDSFFDITYQIDFQGCPGSVLEGFGGTSAGTLRLETGDPIDPVAATTVPGLSGRWLWLLGALLVLSSLTMLMRSRAPS